MNLEENIEKLNIKYKPFKLEFIYQKDKRRILIKENFVINSDPKLKAELKKEFSISFDWANKFWYIGEIGINKLSKSVKKIEPFKSTEELKEELSTFTEMVSDEKLKSSVVNLLKKYPEFFDGPAARYMHHNYKGGLLEHTVQTCKIALAIAKTIQGENVLDMDLLIVGSILHDVGKINCYKNENGKIELTYIYREQDHIINGIKIVSQEIDSDKLDDIIHIIASHHNLKEWGSPVEPNSSEAWIIHFSENLSSKIMG